jgi:hypothetical protein
MNDFPAFQPNIKRHFSMTQKTAVAWMVRLAGFH